jgi:hypothetical protein
MKQNHLLHSTTQESKFTTKSHNQSLSKTTIVQLYELSLQQLYPTHDPLLSNENPQKQSL